MIKAFALYLLIPGCLLLVSNTLMADDTPIRSSSISEQQLLANVFPTSCHFSGTFLQKKTIAGLTFPLQSNGDFFFSCDFGLVWNTTTPFQEALLYANAKTNYKVDDSGNIEPMSGTARYAMAKIFLRLLKGDTGYFAQEFNASKGEDGTSIELKPASEFMKKGINRILVNKLAQDGNNVSLDINIQDAKGQNTHVSINQIIEHAIDNKKMAFEQCKVLYPTPLKWCRVLRSHDHYER